MQLSLQNKAHTIHMKALLDKSMHRIIVFQDSSFGSMILHNATCSCYLFPVMAYKSYSTSITKVMNLQTVITTDALLDIDKSIYHITTF
jgi:hypothetical protein